MVAVYIFIETPAVRIKHMRSSVFGYGRILVCYSLLVVAAACAPSARAVDPFAAPSPDREPGQERIVFTIDNRDYRDATVNAWWGGLRTRVGSVNGNSTQTFRVRWRGDRLYFQLDFIAGGEIRSQGLIVSPGDHVQLNILPGGRTTIQKI